MVYHVPYVCTISVHHMCVCTICVYRYTLITVSFVLAHYMKICVWHHNGCPISGYCLFRGHCWLGTYFFVLNLKKKTTYSLNRKLKLKQTFFLTYLLQFLLVHGTHRVYRRMKISDQTSFYRKTNRFIFRARDEKDFALAPVGNVDLRYRQGERETQILSYRVILAVVLHCGQKKSTCYLGYTLPEV